MQPVVQYGHIEVSTPLISPRHPYGRRGYGRAVEEQSQVLSQVALDSLAGVLATSGGEYINLFDVRALEQSVDTSSDQRVSSLRQHRGEDREEDSNRRSPDSNVLCDDQKRLCTLRLPSDSDHVAFLVSIDQPSCTFIGGSTLGNLFVVEKSNDEEDGVFRLRVLPVEPRHAVAAPTCACTWQSSKNKSLGGSKSVFVGDSGGTIVLWALTSGEAVDDWRSVATLSADEASSSDVVTRNLPPAAAAYRRELAGRKKAITAMASVGCPYDALGSPAPLNDPSGGDADSSAASAVVLLSGCEGGLVRFWGEDGGLLYTHDAFSKDAASSVSALAIVVAGAATGGAYLQAWVGSEGGHVTVLAVDSGAVLLQKSSSGPGSTSPHARGIRSIVCEQAQGNVWTTSEDGVAVAWDPNTFAALCRIVHSSPIVSAVSLGEATVSKIWVVGRHGAVQCYYSACSSALRVGSGNVREEDDNEKQELASQVELLTSTNKELERALDEAMGRVTYWQEEMRRVVVSRKSAVPAAAVALKEPTATDSNKIAAVLGCESHARRVIEGCWAAATESLFVSLLVSIHALQAVQRENVAMMHERDHFKCLLREATVAATQENTARPPLDTDARAAHHGYSPARRPAAVATTVDASVGSPAPAEVAQRAAHLFEIDSVSRRVHAQQVAEHRALLAERDAHIRMLQQEMFALRKETDAQLEQLQRSRVEDVATLRQLCADLRRSNDSLKGDVTVKQDLLTDARNELAAIRDEVRQLKEHNQQLVKSTAAKEDSREKLKLELLAVQVELNELRLEHHRAMNTLQAEKTRLQEDLQAMRLPWEAMRRTLQEQQVELELVKQQAAQSIQQIHQEHHHHQQRFLQHQQTTPLVESRKVAADASASTPTGTNSLHNPAYRERVMQQGPPAAADVSSSRRRTVL